MRPRAQPHYCATFTRTRNRFCTDASPSKWRQYFNAISALPSSAQEQSSQPASTRDLQSIIEAKVLRVAVTQFDLPGFHAQRSDGTLVGAEIELSRRLSASAFSSLKTPTPSMQSSISLRAAKPI